MFSEIADIICPMIYPSHYGKSFFKDLPAAERPYRIVLENTKRAVKIIGGKVVIRPYVQGFNLLSPTWGPDYIRKSTWQEEGYSSFKEWFNSSQTFNAKFFRFNLKFALPGIMILSILSGVIIVILK